MTATVIAADLGLDLYKIDLSGVVSKYIGETEKNLDRIFWAARGSNTILFFDEADVLFGKRSEIKDAHDRYANIEIAYLLQKLAQHNGTVILANNLSKNIDQAFSRRMNYVVEFPTRDAERREMLWRQMFPRKYWKLSPLRNRVQLPNARNERFLERSEAQWKKFFSISLLEIQILVNDSFDNNYLAGGNEPIPFSCS